MMIDLNLDSPPRFLRGVFLREDFDFDQIGSAIEGLSSNATQTGIDQNDGVSKSSERDAEEKPQLSALMSDDDFLSSLLTPLETTKLKTSDAAWSSSNTEPDNAVDARLDAVDAEQNDHSIDEDQTCLHRLQPEVHSVPRGKRFPFAFSWLRELDLEFPNAVTILMGENGSGKSTLLEAIAGLSGFPVWGGGRNDLSDPMGPERESELAQAIYPHFKKRPRDGYFFRAEYYAQFASLLDHRSRDREFMGDPYGRYGGQSLHTRSHGESFMTLMNNRFTDGLFLLDEPESALSPKRQLALLAMMVDRVRRGKSQFIIATHSPILMTFPGATVISLDSASLEAVDYRTTDHFYITQGILENPRQYWKHLKADVDS